MITLIKAILLIAFFIGAAIFIYVQTGWAVFAVFFGIAVLFSPMWLTEPSTVIRADVFIDPTYKLWHGNVSNRDR